jgi:PmbA protein
MFSPSLNMNTGDWSVGVAGYWFEGGAIAHPVSEVTVAGNLIEIYQRVICGADLDDRGSLEIPSLLVDDLAIGGV